ncbi:diguanylate cyclase [Thermosulfuriphilus ammonigenes]|uniref:diguanylate cyclase n=1 Tax=Thermosulfuriphilus ammonigenes TaxID=1936021 RepID=A0A6G7PUF4_9BACT|nr:diguanylate cyclase [Thermosulfuriphilus ammonigenes]MBA2848714.1 diguanylate cyclase (GGDEF)-like protein [Thermosulfuriphilus ammonigenes]QIJ71151.1 diguanylate cyclase [Thermosulfuriphilus ammonigenes]
MGCKILEKIKSIHHKQKAAREDDFQHYSHQEEKNPFCRLLDRIFNMSLFIKIGVIIGLCFLGYVLMAGYFVVQLKMIKTGLDQLEKIYLPEYKVGQIILKHLKNIEAGLFKFTTSPGDPVILKRYELDIRQNIKDGIQLMETALKGGKVKDISETGIIDEFTVYPVNDAQAKKHLVQALEKFRKIEKNFEKLVNAVLEENIDEIPEEDLFEILKEDMSQSEEEISQFIRLVSNKHLVRSDKIERIMEQGKVSSIVVASILIGILIATGYLFIHMVLKPIKEITTRIRNLAEGQEECEETLLEVKTKDEIGLLANEFNRLINQINQFNAFKKIIEEDETVEDIYKRLADVFQEKLGLKTFAIFQVSNSDNKMKPVYLCPEDLEFNPEKLGDANRCRAKRTGHIISSIEYRGICKLFLWKDEVDHICIPMIVGGRTVGVVQFLLPVTKASKELHRYDWSIRQAQVYIREALPVIEAKRFAQSMKEMALKDALTELYNRRFLETYIDTLVAGTLRRGTVLGVLMCDLDYFKEVNDTYGHEVGDEVLKKTAQILKGNIRAADLAIRFGGEEFLILLTDVRQGEAVKVAEKLRQLVERTKFKIPGGQLHKTISIGVSEFPVDSEGIWEAIKYADVALYKAKEAGRNRVVRFTPDMWQSESY